KYQPAAVRRQAGKVVGGRFSPEGYTFSRTVQPLKGPQPFRPARPVRECSATGEVELTKPEIRVVRDLLQQSSCASHLPPVQIKGHREKGSLSHVSQMTARQIPRVHACVLEHNVPPVIRQR